MSYLNPVLIADGSDSLSYTDVSEITMSDGEGYESDEAPGCRARRTDE